MKSRLVASAVISAALILGTTGCTLLATGGTTIAYQPADGVAGSVGDVKILNAIGLSDNGEDVSLLMTVLNTSAEDIDLIVQYTDSSGAKVNLTLAVPAKTSVSVGTGAPDLVLRDAGVVVGSSVDVYFQYRGEPGDQLRIPILDGSTAAYADLLPEPLPSVTPTATPDPTETPGPTETPTS